MSPFREALLALGHGEWCFKAGAVRVARAAALVLGLISLFCDTAVAEPAPVKLRAWICSGKACRTRGSHGFAPVTVELEAVIPADSRNRLVRLLLICDSFPLRAEEDASMVRTLYRRTFVNVEAGECTPAVELLRNDGTYEAVMAAPLTVIGR